MKHILKKCGAISLAAILSLSFMGTVKVSAETEYTHYTQMFEGDRVLDVYVSISEEDWESILDSPLDKDYKNVTVDFDGITLENVGFSTKGNSTLTSVASSDESDRYSFRLKFDKFDKEQSLLGLNKISLNNNLSDASYLREYLHYEALGLTDIPVPCTTFVNLYINGELYGLYTGVEQEEESFLQRYFGDDYKSGALYEAEEHATLQYEDSEEYSKLSLDIGKDEDNENLKNFIKILNEMPEGEKGEIESVLDVNSALSYIAANTVFGNYDSYNGEKSHNYKLYIDKDGKTTVIPWDFNMSFDGFTMGAQNAVSVSIDEPISGTTAERTPLITNLLAVTEYKEQYISYIELFTEYLEGVEERANQLADLIRPHVQADPTKFYSMEEFESNLVYSEDSRNNTMKNFPADFADREMPNYFDQKKPDRPDNFGELPTEFPEGFPERPEGFENMPEGFMSRGGGIMGSSGSLVTFATDRSENIREQLH